MRTCAGEPELGVEVTRQAETCTERRARPRLDRVGATWVDPVVVVEARTLEVTRDGRLRQPAYLGLRADLTPEDLQEVDGA